MKFLTWIAQFLKVFDELISKMPKFSIFDNFFPLPVAVLNLLHKGSETSFMMVISLPL